MPRGEDVSDEVAHLFEDRPEFAAKTFTLLDLNAQIARHFGVDPVLCAAYCFVESGFDPEAKGDWTLNGDPHNPLVVAGTPGSLPTSFGWYQLHKDGELGSMTPTEAYNPVNNANVSISHLAACKRLRPELSGGALAAFAQGPADQAAYARIVDEYVADINAGRPPQGFLQASGVAWTGAQPYPPTPVVPPILPDVDVFITANPNPGGGDFLCAWSTRRAVGIPNGPDEIQAEATGVERHNINAATFAYFTHEVWAAPTGT